MISVVIPAYNEKGIGRVLDDLASHVSVPFEILVIIDFAGDPTKWVVSAHARNRPLVRHLGGGDILVRLIQTYANGRGPRAAILSGFAAALGEYAVVMMADGSDDAVTINGMVAAAGAGADVVCGSRYMRGGRQIGGPLLKGALSCLAGLSLYWTRALPVHDATNNFKLYRREVLELICPGAPGGLELGLELVVRARAAGFNVSEVPTTWRDRTSGKSRFRWRWLPRYLYWYFAAILRSTAQ